MGDAYALPFMFHYPVFDGCGEGCLLQTVYKLLLRLNSRSWAPGGCYQQSPSVAIGIQTVTRRGFRWLRRGAALSHWRGCRFLQRGVDQVLEVLQAGAAADGVAVDEEEWGAVYAEAVAFLAVLVDLRFEAVGVQVFGESRDVQV